VEARSQPSLLADLPSRLSLLVQLRSRLSLLAKLPSRASLLAEVVVALRRCALGLGQEVSCNDR
jgi:hypothetical protein